MLKMSSRRRRGLAAAVVVLALLGVGLQVRLFLRPRVDKPSQTGLVVVLGNIYRGDRLQLAQQLASKNRELLVVALHGCPPWFAHYFQGYARMGCFSPSPETTRGEARYATAEARRRSFHDIMVITTEDQVTRARIRFERCFSGEVRVLRAPLSTWES